MHIIIGLLALLVGVPFTIRYWLRAHWFASAMMFFAVWLTSVLGLAEVIPAKVEDYPGPLVVLTIVSTLIAFIVAMAPTWVRRADNQRKLERDAAATVSVGFDSSHAPAEFAN